MATANEQQNQKKQQQRRQCVYFVRYGLTKYPLVENVGPYDSPLHPLEGYEQGVAIGPERHRASEMIREDGRVTSGWMLEMNLQWNERRRADFLA